MKSKPQPSKRPAPLVKKPAAAPTPAPTLAGEVTEPESSAPSAIDDELQKIAEVVQREGMDGGTIKLERRTLTDTEHQYLGEMAVGNFSMETVKQVFGGGDYKWRAHTSRNQFAGGGRFTISHMIPAKIPGIEQSTAAPGSQGDVAAMFEKFAAMLKPVVDRAMQPPPAPVAPDNSVMLQMMKSQGDMTLALITAMVSKPAQPDPSIAILTAKVEALAAAKQSGGGFKEAREIFEFLKENTVPEKDEKEPGFLDSIGKGIGNFLPVLAQQMAGGGQRPALQLPQSAPIPAHAIRPVHPIAPVAPAGNGAAADSPQPIETTAIPAPDNTAMNPFFSRFASMAIKAVNAKKEPDEFVDAVMMAASGFEEHVYAMASDDDWKRKIFAGPNWVTIEPHGDWLDEVRAAVLERQFVDYCERAVAANLGASVALGHYITKQMPKFYLPYVDGMTDAEEIREVFDGSNVPAEWVEDARTTIEALMKSAEDQAKTQRAAAQG